MEPSIYTDRAALYDLIYDWKPYAAECEVIAARLNRLGVPDGSRVLDAACGTGNHIARLSPRFEMSGFDLSEGMIALARGKLPHVPLFRADLARFTVDRPHDAILCLFSAIGYVFPEARLRSAAGCLFAAVRPGGVLLVEPWFTPETWNAGRPHVIKYSSPDLCLARAAVADRDGDLAVMDMHWLVARRGQPVEHFVDTHRVWLAPTATLLAAFTDAGFEAAFDPNGLMDGRGLVVARRPSV
jgi:SAM-dependent methyltransferase